MPKGSRTMKRGNALRTLGIALSLVIGGSSAAFARDVCVNFAGAGDIVFKKVKRLKPGGAIPLDGIYVLGTTTSPVSGTALMRSDRTVRLGLQLFTRAPDGQGGTVNSTVTVKAADETYAGTGLWENEPADGTPDGVATFTSIDCATVVIP